ncbi:MAG: DUF1846 domain-containing protein [Kiritimatiellaeota bacterium]|nr:DUF1846 domain-containing protein [Kiritimatiellota bacterium]
MKNMDTLPLFPHAFDNQAYIDLQSRAIMERAARFGGKLYLEVGGKLMQDLHAARILPGFDPDVKIRMLQHLTEQIEIIVCVYAGDIEYRRYRTDFGTTYDSEVLRTIDEVRKWGLFVRAVVMTRFDDAMKAAAAFAAKLERLGITVVRHGSTVGYPDDVDRILSPEGYGLNPFIETERPIVCVIAPGPSSGKLATCLTQLYHGTQRGIRAGYAKYETFPVWDLPLTHPVNVAYEAATADIADYNQIDPFHLEAYGKTAINYNRDTKAFPILRTLLSRVMEQDAYKSPTDMGVNMVASAIVADDAVRRAACQEIIRRYFQSDSAFVMGRAAAEVSERIRNLMRNFDIKETDRPTVQAARDAISGDAANGKGFQGICCGAAIELKDGTLITGRNSSTLRAASSAILNALKHLAGIPDWIHLLPENIVQCVTAMKSQNLRLTTSYNLNVEELLIALAIAALHNNGTKRALDCLPSLKDCDMHMTHITTDSDEAGLRRLGIRLTTDPLYPTKELFVQ